MKILLLFTSFHSKPVCLSFSCRIQKTTFWKLSLKYLLLCPTEERLTGLEQFSELFTNSLNQSVKNADSFRNKTCGCFCEWIIHWTDLLTTPLLSFWEMCNCSAMALLVTSFIGKSKTDKVTRNIVYVSICSIICRNKINMDKEINPNGNASVRNIYTQGIQQTKQET